MILEAKNHYKTCTFWKQGPKSIIKRRFSGHKGDREGSARQAMENFRFFGAPHTAILTSGTELGPYGAMDCGGFVTAFTLAAQALGVATIAQAALAAQAPFLHSYFSIPDDRLVLCGISFGYEDPDHPANGFRTARAEVADIIDWKA